MGHSENGAENGFLVWSGKCIRKTSGSSFSYIVITI